MCEIIAGFEACDPFYCDRIEISKLERARASSHSPLGGSISRDQFGLVNAAAPEVSGVQRANFIKTKLKANVKAK